MARATFPRGPRAFLLWSETGETERGDVIKITFLGGAAFPPPQRPSPGDN